MWYLIDWFSTVEQKTRGRYPSQSNYLQNVENETMDYFVVHFREWGLKRRLEFKEMVPLADSSHLVWPSGNIIALQSGKTGLNPPTRGLNRTNV